jgi:hypothetical protein
MINKLLLNYAWWLNRKDNEHHDLFEGGFMGLDNISVYDRSKPLPFVSRAEDPQKIRAHIWRRITLSSTQQKRAVIGPLFI